MCMTTLGNRPGSCFSATADTASTHVGLLQLLLGGPLRVAPAALLVVYAPSPNRTTAHAMPTQRSRSSTPYAHRCPTPGIRAKFFSPPFRIASNPQDRLPSPTRSTAPRNPSHVRFSQTCAVPLDTPTPCFPNRKWGAMEYWKGTAKPSPHFVLVKRGCAPWPSFTAIGPSRMRLLSFQERSHDCR